MPSSSPNAIVEFPPPPLPRSKPPRTYGKNSPPSTSSSTGSGYGRFPFASEKASREFKSPSMKTSSSAPSKTSPTAALISPFQNMGRPSFGDSSSTPSRSTSQTTRIKEKVQQHRSSSFEEHIDEDPELPYPRSTQARHDPFDDQEDDEEEEEEEPIETGRSASSGVLKRDPSGLSEPMDLDEPSPVTEYQTIEEAIEHIFGTSQTTSDRTASAESAKAGGVGGSRTERKRKSASPDGKQAEKRWSGEGSLKDRKYPPMQNGRDQVELLQDEEVYLHDEDEDNDDDSDSDDSDSDDSDSDSEEDEDTDEDEEDDDRIVIHVEARLKANSTMLPSSLEQILKSWLENAYPSAIPANTIAKGWKEIKVLEKSFDRVWIAESGLRLKLRVEPDMVAVPTTNARLVLHIYSACENEEVETFAGLGDDDDEDNQVPAATVRELPSPLFEGLWDNLIYADNLKPRLLNYIHSTIVFSEAEVDFNVVTWNRLVLLHGPPGTGKTSLCRGLAQKLSIRLRDLYDHTEIVEINSHSLFSKWFSESGKLVQKLFSTVMEKVADPRTFVVVMIDEVESLTAARSGASSSEPSDALRVVNALLTQLDKLKTKKNVLVMTTSNIAGAIDSAFVDRADIKEYVDFPPPEAVYWILTGCIKAIRRSRPRLCRKASLLSWRECQFALMGREERESSPSGSSSSRKLNGHLSARQLKEKKDKKKLRRKVDVSLRVQNLAKACHKNNLAGRFLRRLPVLAHSKHLAAPRKRQYTIEEWVTAMEKVVAEEERDRGKIEHAIGSKGA